MTFRIDCRLRGQRTWNISRAVLVYRPGVDLPSISPERTLQRMRAFHPRYFFRLVWLSPKRQETRPEPI